MLRKEFASVYLANMLEICSEKRVDPPFQENPSPCSPAHHRSQFRQLHKIINRPVSFRDFHRFPIPLVSSPLPDQA
jgi:hypothetical protein